jgi:hypothetical protein
VAEYVEFSGEIRHVLRRKRGAVKPIDQQQVRVFGVPDFQVSEEPSQFGGLIAVLFPKLENYQELVSRSCLVFP